METHVDFEVAHLCPHTHGLESAIPKSISFSVDQVWVAAWVSVSLEVQLFLSSLSLFLSFLLFLQVATISWSVWCQCICIQLPFQPAGSHQCSTAIQEPTSNCSNSLIHTAHRQACNSGCLLVWFCWVAKAGVVDCAQNDNGFSKECYFSLSMWQI